MSNAKPRQRGDFKPKLIALSVTPASVFPPRRASPIHTGGTVSSGSASFAARATADDHQHANAIINCRAFDRGQRDHAVSAVLWGSSACSTAGRARTE